MVARMSTARRGKPSQKPASPLSIAPRPMLSLCAAAVLAAHCVVILGGVPVPGSIAVGHGRQ